MNKIILFIFILFVFGCEDKKVSLPYDKYKAPVSQDTLSFIRELNPELIQKVKNIKNELKESDSKIEQLELLKKFYSNQKEILDRAISQWSELHKSLYEVYHNIFIQIEKTYVIYQVNEIEGNKNFENESKKLINQANKALENAQNTKSIIERSLYNE